MLTTLMKKNLHQVLTLYFEIELFV